MVISISILGFEAIHDWLRQLKRANTVYVDVLFE
jgi:hypothetical protein